MGVKGLRTFIEDNDDLLIRNYELHDTDIIVDACNLISRLIYQSEKQRSSKSITDNRAQFEHLVLNLFSCFRECSVRPILVFDGEESRYKNKRKTFVKHRQALERFQKLMLSSKQNSKNFLTCSSATEAFKSLATREGFEIVQCLYEADLQVARLSHILACPVMSNDTDFYLIDLPYGLFFIDLMQQLRPQNSLARDVISRTQTLPAEGMYSFINCCFFHQDHFTTYFPNLDKKNLPLLAILCGNDLISSQVFERICSQLPSRIIADRLGLSIKQFRQLTNRRHEKIVKVLYFLCDKSLEENVNRLCSYFPKSKRPDMKKLIKRNIAAYDVPTDLEMARTQEDESEITNLCDKLKLQHL